MTPHHSDLMSQMLQISIYGRVSHVVPRTKKISLDRKKEKDQMYGFKSSQLEMTTAVRKFTL